MLLPAISGRARLRLLLVGSLFSLAAAQAVEEVQADFGSAILDTWVQPQYPEAARKAKQEGKVVVEFVVEADGAVTREQVGESSAEVFNQPVLDAVKHWHFRPAIENGKPAASAMQAPVEFNLQQLRQKTPPLMPDIRLMPVPFKVEPAHAESGNDVEYPPELESQRLPGFVRIRFTVDPSGVVRQPQVLFASHPAFVDRALRMLERAKFVPERQGPLTRAATLEYPVGFESFGAKTADVLAANHLERTDDSPARFLPVVMVQPVYPREKLLAGESATVIAEFKVTAEGRTENVLITDPTSGVFGDALRAAIESWIFQLERGSDAGSAQFKVTYEFSAASAESRLAPLLQPDGGGIKGPAGLDQKLKPLWRGFPVYPQNLLAERPQGRAVIEFVIDRDGRARTPRIVEATAPEFGWAGMTAVSQWVFERPLRGGEPVDVLVRVPVEFQPPK